MSIQSTDFEGICRDIRSLMDRARKAVATHVNSVLIETYWQIGKIIVEDEQRHSNRAEYGKELLQGLARRLSKEYGRGFSKSNLFYMRGFYLKHPIFQTLSGKLTWSHYCELLSIGDDGRRGFYEKECASAGWSIRELRRQVATSLYERLLLSPGVENKSDVMKLALKGNEITKAGDLLKDPYVLEFVGIPEDTRLLEGDLERALIAHIENFLLELGKGFMYVGSQQRVTLGNTHYYVDMVFYNKILHSYVLIELKSGKLTPEAVGQLNMYLNYYRAEVNDEADNEPIGILLCADKDSVQAEYALGGLSNTIFASRYTLYIPHREMLEAEVEKVLKSLRK